MAAWGARALPLAGSRARGRSLMVCDTVSHSTSPPQAPFSTSTALCYTVTSKCISCRAGVFRVHRFPE